MQPRKLLLDQFSSFLQLADDRFQGWRPNPRLHRSMTLQLQALPGSPASDQFWSLYWHNHWQAQSHGAAEQHLLAYLQEPCYWVAQEVSRKVVGLQSQAATSYTPVDYFQMALADTPLALSKFQPEKSSYLKAFAQVFLSNRIKSRLRQQRQADFCSVWGLLRKTSRKQLLAVLQGQGIGTAEIEQYRLLWMGLQARFVPAHPDSSKCAEPDRGVWQEIAQFYNQQRLTFLNSAAPSLDEGEVERRLRSLSSWIRSYHYPQIDSLNRARFGGEEPGKVEEWQDTLPNPDQGALLQTLIAQEEQVQRGQVQLQLRQQLALAFGQLDGQSRLILELLYREGLPQQEVMLQVQLSQPTISRRLAKAKTQLTQALLIWASGAASPGGEE
jgi:RNA polymerase sigma factor (sigma-70 family)